MSDAANQLQIEVGSRIHLSPLREGDKEALASFLNEETIYDHTLRIPFP